ncbi:MAG: hypothetical protein CTY19_02415 [Methylomonas sp.]|nr:MAG: hypothetical protein CTY19_02415 [Methylomonas sp.]
MSAVKMTLLSVLVLVLPIYAPTGQRNHFIYKGWIKNGLLVGLIFFSQISITQATDDLFAKPTLRAGIHVQSFPDFSAEDVEVSVKLLSEEIGRDMGIETSVTAYEDIKALKQDFDTGVINFVVASTILFASHFDTDSFSNGFRFVRQGIATDTLLLLGQAKQGLTRFDSYQGKRLILAEFDPLAEIYLDILSRKHFKKSFIHSFKLMKREKKSHQLILKLFFDQADLACVYRTAYQVAIELNPELQHKLFIVSEIDNIPQGIGLFHKNVPEAFRASVIAQATKLHGRTRGEQLLQLFKSDHVVYADTSDLAGAITLNAEYQRALAGH